MIRLTSARIRSSRTLPFAVAAVALFALLGLSRSTPVADAGMIVIPVDYFPPFSDTGTIIVTLGPADDPNGPTCTFFLADHGGLYFFNGIDSFKEGDRLLLIGQSCLICLSYNICEVPAAPIINATAVPIGPAPTLTDTNGRARKAVTASAL